MKEKIKVAYVGYHIETLNLLSSDDKFEVVGTGLIEEFISDTTLNPINLFFKLIYNLRLRNQCRMLECLLLFAWRLVSRFATSFYCTYSDYLKTISERKIEIVDFSNNHKVRDFLEVKSVDLMVVSAWSILPQEIIVLPKFGTVNIHPSRLPQYRGALPTLWSLKNGDWESAVTYTIMDKAIDAGAIIGQHAFPISAGDDWHSMELKINEILQATLLSDLKGFIAGDIKPAEQDIRIRSNTGKYYEYMKIDWDKENGNDIYNKVNLYPFLVPKDYCYTFLNARKIVIKKAAFINSQAALLKFGQFHIQGLRLLIQAKSGIIVCKMFSGLGVKDSILFVLKRRGNFT